MKKVIQHYPYANSILDVPRSIVFDAGCGYGSESFLFAKLGATVLSVDRSFEQIAIARKRLRYYEELFEQKLDIHFVTADLNEYIPEMAELSLTWLASVLAAIRDQEAFLARVYQATRPEGRVILTDMNLWNPLFLVKEWGRRRRNQMDSPEFARSADFLAMVRRKGRKGARFFPSAHGAMIDDVQFFTPVTLSQLLRTVGFCQVTSTYSGFLPPPLFSPIGLMLERSLDKVPILRGMGYFYLVSGQK